MVLYGPYALQTTIRFCGAIQLKSVYAKQEWTLLLI